MRGVSSHSYGIIKPRCTRPSKNAVGLSPSNSRASADGRNRSLPLRPLPLLSPIVLHLSLRAAPPVQASSTSRAPPPPPPPPHEISSRNSGTRRFSLLTSAPEIWQSRSEWASLVLEWLLSGCLGRIYWCRHFDGKGAGRGKREEASEKRSARKERDDVGS